MERYVVGNIAWLAGEENCHGLLRRQKYRHRSQRSVGKLAKIITVRRRGWVKSVDNQLNAKITHLYKKDLIVYNLIDNLIVQIGQIFIIL